MSEDKNKDRYEIATDYHHRGYNCCQSVCFAFLDHIDLDEKTLFRVTEGLGLGMGGMEGTCGAISAATVLAGLKCSTADLEHPNSCLLYTSSPASATRKLSGNAARRALKLSSPAASAAGQHSASPSASASRSSGRAKRIV